MSPTHTHTHTGTLIIDDERYASGMRAAAAKNVERQFILFVINIESINQFIVRLYRVRAAKRPTRQLLAAAASSSLFSSDTKITKRKLRASTRWFCAQWIEWALHRSIWAQTNEPRCGQSQNQTGYWRLNEMLGEKAVEEKTGAGASDEI